MKFTDTSIMPYGKHQGKLMCRVPADYLLWLHDNGKCSPLVKAYVEENIDALKQKQAEQQAEAERQRNNRRMLRTMCK